MAKSVKAGCAIEKKPLTRKGEIVMGTTGKKDKGNKEQKKKPKHNLKEKRKLKNEKKTK